MNPISCFFNNPFKCLSPRILKLFLVPLMFSLSPSLQAHATDSACEESLVAGTLAEGRLFFAIDRIQQSLEQVFAQHRNFSALSNLEQAEILLAANLRNPMFGLQSLGRMYRALDRKNIAEVENFTSVVPVAELVKKLGKLANTIEDTLGHYDLLKKEGRIEEQAKEADSLHKSLYDTGLLNTDGPGPLFTEWSKEISELKWPSENKDRRFVLSVTLEQIDKVLRTKYDMAELEDGLHEFRRELRWIVLYASASNGLFEKSDAGEFQCKQTDLIFKDFIDPKYSSLTTNVNVENKCTISACLFDQLVGAVGQFGAYKDNAETTMAQLGSPQNRHLVNSSRQPN